MRMNYNLMDVYILTIILTSLALCNLDDHFEALLLLKVIVLFR